MFTFPCLLVLFSQFGIFTIIIGRHHVSPSQWVLPFTGSVIEQWFAEEQKGFLSVSAIWHVLKGVSEKWSHSAVSHSLPSDGLQLSKASSLGHQWVKSLLSGSQALSPCLKGKRKEVASWNQLSDPWRWVLPEASPAQILWQDTGSGVRLPPIHTLAHLWVMCVSAYYV